MGFSSASNNSYNSNINLYTRYFNTTFIYILVIVGYLSRNMIIGTKNAVFTGAISFFLGSLFAGSFLYIILYLILGIINGAVCGLIGGYIKTKRQII